MLLGEHYAILSNFIKLPFVLKTFVLSILEWPFKTGLTVDDKTHKVEILMKTSHLSLIQFEDMKIVDLSSNRNMCCEFFASGDTTCFINE